MKTIVRVFALVALVMVIAPAGGAPDGVSRIGVDAAARVPAPVPTVEEQIAMLQKQVTALQGQVALLQSALQVTPTGTTLQGPAISIISQGGTLLRSDRETSIMTGSDLMVRVSSGLTIKASTTAQIESSAGLTLKGSAISLNGGGRPLATVGSLVSNGAIVTGSTTVFGG